MVDAVTLAKEFREQQQFAEEYSPLYVCICATLARWLEAGEEAHIVTWMLDAGQSRYSFEIPLLLLAGLHRDVLAGEPGAQQLSRYYATAGKSRPCDATDFPFALRQAIWSNRNRLSEFLSNAQVQTNETGRGIAWLLPAAQTGWEAIHLVDLGASAGLNLVADQRAYRLVTEDGNRVLADLGRAVSPQFVVTCTGEAGEWRDSCYRLPRIVARTGCDIDPFELRSLEDELKLAAFVWGDHPQRLQRLREGISALQAVNLSDAPVRLHAVNLPDGLSWFLEEYLRHDPAVPIVAYNTYMTKYLADKGAELRRHIQEWARADRRRPVLWLQWEPAWDGDEPPETGWVRWTADLWTADGHRQWHLAWAHPHGTHVRWEPGFTAWTDFWKPR